MDSVAGVVPSGGPSVREILAPAFAAARPSTLVLLVVCITGLVAVWSLLRVPRDYPFRGAVLSLALLGMVGSGGLLVYRAAHVAADGLPAVATEARRVVANQLAGQHAGPLESYVPLMAGERAEHATITSASSDARDAWVATVPASPRAIIDYYRTPANHAGWFLEFDSPTMLVFRRSIAALTVRGTERIRVRVDTTDASHARHGSAHTSVEYVVTRRF